LFPFFPLLFLFLSSLFPLKMVSSIFSNCPLFHPPLSPLSLLVFIRGERGRESYYPCPVMTQG
jgi:hypothetical protein